MSERKHTFDQIPELYNQVRPGYPEAVLKAVRDYAKLGSASEIVEIGAGTGKATQYFASLGCNITAVEPGANLCTFLKNRFFAQLNVRIEHTTFEDWPGEAGFYDLCLSAQAFHWIPAQIGIGKAAQVLKPAGTLALLWNVDYSQESEFFKRATPIHEKYFPGKSEKPESQTIVMRYEGALRECVLFNEFKKEECAWTENYSAEELIRLRSTFSTDLMLPDEKRAEFYLELRELIDNLGGTVTRFYRTVALLAKKKS